MTRRTRTNNDSPRTEAMTNHTSDPHAAAPQFQLNGKSSAERGLQLEKFPVCCRHGESYGAGSG